MADGDLPPPYVARDPGPANARAQEEEVPTFDEVISGSSRVSPDNIGEAVQSVILRLENLERGTASTAEPNYFKIRPPKESKPTTFLVHLIVIQPVAGPENFKYPGMPFKERDVNEYDWMTFLNHVFIEDTLNSVQGRVVSEKGRPVTSPTTRAAKAEELKPKNATQDAERRSKLTATVDDWNEGFFGPRAIRVRAKVVRTPNLTQGLSMDIDARPSGGETALSKAVRMGDLESTRLLLSRGADPNQHSSGARPMLSAACSKACDNPGFFWTTKGSEAHREIMYLLLAHGADLDCRPSGGSSALHTFASRKQTQLVSLLIRWGADVDNQFGHTPSAMLEAVHRGDYEMTKLLLEAGADTDNAPIGTRTAMQEAVRNGDRKLLELLLQHNASVDDKISWSYGSPVHCALDRGDVSILRILLSRGADPNKTSQGREPPLHNAINKNKIECAQTLLEWGADPMTTAHSRETALAIAVGRGQLDLVREMLKVRKGNQNPKRQQELVEAARRAAVESDQNQNPNPNPFNPTHSQVNCFYVCCGRMLGISSDDVARLAEHMQPGGELAGEDLHIMQDVCRTLGLESATDFNRVPWGKTPMGVAFHRRDGSGHCLVREPRGFMDYQVDYRGVDESKDGLRAQVGGHVKFWFWRKH